MSKKPTILIAGTLIVDKIQFKKVLADEYLILDADNGEKAFKMLEDNTVDLIILDANIVSPSCYEFLLRLKKDKSTANVPCIVYTSRNSTEDELTCLEFGIDDFLTKPFDNRVVKQRIKNAILRSNHEKAIDNNRGTQQFIRLIDNAPGGMIMFNFVDGKAHIQYANDGFFDMYSLDKDKYEQLLYSDPLSFVNTYDEHILVDKINEATSGKKDLVICEVRIMCGDGTYKWTLARMKFIKKDSNADTILVILIDISAEHKTRVELEYLTKYESVSGVYSKKAFCTRTKELLDTNLDKQYVMIVTNIERFKFYNDAFGTIKGDALLQTIGKKLKSLFGPTSTYGRLESDHFVMCFEEGLYDIDFLTDAITQEVQNGDENYDVLVGFGVYHIADRSLSVEQMYDRAMMAMQSIKGNYIERVGVYEEKMRSKVLREQEIQNNMANALQNDEFKIYLQPIVNDYLNSVVCAEVLVRWICADGTKIMPNDFIPLFERNGFITKMDEVVWEKACALLRNWLDKGEKVIPLSVNLSRHDLYNPGLADTLTALINKYRIDVSMLRLEITETAYANNPNIIIDKVNELRSRGFTIEMDDFGSGYSSLNMLKDVSVDVLKIDLKFLQGGTDRSGNILNSIIRMGKWLQMPIIVEGVETLSEAEYLKSIGCRYMQGYYFARPMPVDEFEQYLDDKAVANVSKSDFNSLIDINDFWNPQSQTTLVFNNFVGGAAVVEMTGDNVDAIRLNDEFFTETCIEREDFTVVSPNFLRLVREEDREGFVDILKECKSLRKPVQYEFRIVNPVTDNERWLQARMQTIASSDFRTIFFISIRNITQRILMEIEMRQVSDMKQRMIENLNQSNLKLVQAEKELVASTSRLNNVINNIPVGVAIFNKSQSYKLVFVSNEWCSMFGYSVDEWKKNFEERGFYFIKNPAEILGNLKSSDAFGHKYESVFSYVNPKGKNMWLSLMGEVVSEDGSDMVYATLADVTQKVIGERREHWQQEKNRVIIEDLHTLTFDYDPETDILNYESYNDNGKYIEYEIKDYLKYKEHIEGRIHPDSMELYLKSFKIALKKAVTATIDFRANYFKKGYIWMSAHYVSLMSDDGKVYRIVGRLDDIDHEVRKEQTRQRIEDDLRDKAEYDSITRVYNKGMTEEMINKALLEVSSTKHASMIMFDLDNFKSINDTHGHLVGDELLREIGYISKSMNDSSDIIGRVGGDEFVFYLWVEDQEEVERRLNIFSQKIAKLKDKLKLNHNVTASMGVVYFDTATSYTFEDVFRMADSAMYRAKDLGKGRYEIYRSANDTVVKSELKSN